MFGLTWIKNIFGGISDKLIAQAEQDYISLLPKLKESYSWKVDIVGDIIGAEDTYIRGQLIEGGSTVLGTITINSTDGYRDDRVVETIIGGAISLMRGGPRSAPWQTLVEWAERISVPYIDNKEIS